MRCACVCARSARAAPASDEITLTFGLPYIHSVFDVAAWLSSVAVFWFSTRRLLPAGSFPADKVGHPGAYALAAGCGALVGAMFFGTFNTWLSGVRAIGFSMAGGVAGAVASVELFKHLTGIKGSTGIAFAAPFCATVAVGRLGCFFAGLGDFTYGTPTTLPWGVDFGDGVQRHPVQLPHAPVRELHSHGVLGHQYRHLVILPLAKIDTRSTISTSANSTISSVPTCAHWKSSIELNSRNPIPPAPIALSTRAARTFESMR